MPLETLARVKSPWSPTQEEFSGEMMSHGMEVWVWPKQFSAEPTGPVSSTLRPVWVSWMSPARQQHWLLSHSAATSRPKTISSTAAGASIRVAIWILRVGGWANVVVWGYACV